MLECLTFRDMGALIVAPAAVCAEVLHRASFLTANRRLEHTDEFEFPMWISATQIAACAKTEEVQSSLPRLVRRLVHAAGIPTQVAFPAGDSTNLPGGDGELATESNSPWVPKGKSFCESSCEAPVTRKANRDYDKAHDRRSTRSVLIPHLFSSRPVGGARRHGGLKGNEPRQESLRSRMQFSFGIRHRPELHRSPLPREKGWKLR